MRVSSQAHKNRVLFYNVTDCNALAAARQLNVVYNASINYFGIPGRIRDHFVKQWFSFLMKPIYPTANLYPLILGTVLVLSLGFGYFSIRDNSIDPDVLASVKNENPTDPALLEKNRVLVLMMTERGWFFILVSGFTVAVILGKGLSNIRPGGGSFKKYQSRLIEKLGAKRRYLEFPKRLRMAYPNLTNHDLKVAEMLMEGWSSKEISSALNISPASVNTARYRLRKRMGLSPKTDLMDILRQL